ncbi:hypothetical protein CIK76_02645 [Glutamicibacter sp. BW80]|nr:hypothetical protein CIK76_02645 [Glutamicibacter sp. BW80]
MVPGLPPAWCCQTARHSATSSLRFVRPANHLSRRFGTTSANKVTSSLFQASAYAILIPGSNLRTARDLKPQRGMNTMMGMNGAPAGDPFQPHLEWGLKASFVGYISSLPDGRIEASNGVWQVGNNLAFPVAVDAKSPEGELRFNGRVSFVGHGGMMKLDLIEPRIEEHDDLVLLSVANENGERLPIAELVETAVSNAFGLVKTRFAASLTEQGSALFNGQYKAGQDMEPVEVVLRG